MALTHTITIHREADDPAKPLMLLHLDSDGQSQGDLITADQFQVNPGDKVRWNGGLGIENFSVLFQDEAPFIGEVVSLGTKKSLTTSARTVKKIGGTMAVPVNKAFKYSVTVVEGGGLVVTTVDPDMEIVDNGGGGGI